MKRPATTASMILAVLLTLTACGGGTPAPAGEATSTAAAETQESVTEGASDSETTQAPEETEVTEETTKKAKKNKHEIKIEQDITSLSEYFAGDFKVGTALTPNEMLSRNVMALVNKHFSDSLTCGNEMKPDYVLNKADSVVYFKETGDDTNPQVSFTQAKTLLDYCSENHIPMRVHTLVWHSQTPTWFFKEGYDENGEWVTPEKMTKRMENYIKNYFETLTSLYPDIEFYACDVVNEAWMENGSPRTAGQREEKPEYSPWVKVYGDNSFIEPAFTFARKYAPEGCKLYYNDYNEYMDGKLAAIKNMALELKEKGIIDGIGMQSHLDVRTGSDAFPSVAMYNKALDTYAELGLDIQVTELDATIPANSGDKYFEAQAEYYKGIMSSIYAHKDNISALIFWGVTDDRSWRRDQQPLLFRKDFTAKPAFYSIVGIKEEAQTAESETAGESEDEVQDD
ncbi:MAG: endo-1,4-beta-xylanase [Oscillospiraceae bacterium]|nr:endo-1,4-beta-xylanase [Oscillospiraceae bacterium]